MNPPKIIIQLAEHELTKYFPSIIPLAILRDDVTRAIKNYREAKKQKIAFDNEKKEIKQWLDSINETSDNPNPTNL